LRILPEFTAIFPDFSSDRLTNARVQNIHRIMLEYYRAMIPPDNQTKLYPFTLRKGGNIYGLVFGSSHLLGVEKFLDLAWHENAINGEANFDIDDDWENQMPVLFPELRRLTKREAFERDLEKFISDSRETTNRDVYEFTMANGHPKIHARECIIRLRKEKKIDCPWPFGISYKGCISRTAKLVHIRILKHG
jgi:hypothetical protein